MIADSLVERLIANAVVGPSAQVHTTTAPFSGGVAARIPLSTQADVDQAFAIARRAQKGWSATSVRERASVLERFHDLVLARQDEGMNIAQIETGKARRDAYEELADCALNARYYAQAGPGIIATEHRQGVFPVLTDTVVHHHPKGVVGIISPWNYPITLAVTDALPALLAGNAVVLRPDLQTTVTALWALDVLRTAGLPEGVMTIVIGDGPDLGPLLIERADYISFTGSTRVGREVAAECGRRLIGCSLELGGKNALIVRADADIERSVEIAERAAFGNAGQLCVGTERILVHADIAERFIPAFVARVEAMTIKSGVGWGSDMGSLISARQLERVQGQVEDAVAKGATVLTGGKPRPEIGPYYFAPTLLTNVSEPMTLCREETFGPVAAIYTFSSDDEAIERANDSEFGLNAAILTKDNDVARVMAAKIQAGTVNINEAYGAAWASISSPMGGMKASGLGRRHGSEGILKYTEPQTVSVQRGLGFGAPFGRSDEQWAGMMTSAFKALKRLGVK